MNKKEKYPCEECDYKASQKAAFTEHMKMQHKDSF